MKDLIDEAFEAFIKKHSREIISTQMAFEAGFKAGIDCAPYVAPVIYDTEPFIATTEGDT